MIRRTWERVQRVERAYHQKKDSGKVLAHNRVYWSRILAALPPGEVRIEPGSRVLDLGCGGAGILLGLESGQRTGVDPLMPFYLEKFPFLTQSPVRWLEGKAETFGGDERYDVVFSINMLDHVEDIGAAAANMERLMAPGGRLVLLVSTHTTRIGRLYFSLFYRLVDPPHPHHLHGDAVSSLFPGLRLVARREADTLWLDIGRSYEREVLGRNTSPRIRLARSLVNPFKYPLAAARLAGRPVHRARPTDRPLIESSLYLFAKDAG